MFKITAVAIVLASAFTLPAFASDAMMATKCDDASMMTMKGKIDGMTDMAHKKMAMSEMMMAQSSMKAHKMKSCSMHMDKATKDMGTKM